MLRISARTHVIQLVNEHAKKIGESSRLSYDRLFLSYFFKTGKDVRVEAARIGIKPLSYVAGESDMPLLESIAMNTLQ